MYPVAIESILYCSVEIAGHFGACGRNIGTNIHHQLVGNVEVGQCCLHHIGCRIIKDFGSCRCGLDQHRMHLSPRRVVTNRHRGVEDIARPAGVLSQFPSVDLLSTLEKSSCEIRVITQANRKMPTVMKFPGNETAMAVTQGVLSRLNSFHSQ